MSNENENENLTQLKYLLQQREEAHRSALVELFETFITDEVGRINTLDPKLKITQVGWLGTSWHVIFHGGAHEATALRQLPEVALQLGHMLTLAHESCGPLFRLKPLRFGSRVSAATNSLVEDAMNH